ncbi:hypothetical protein [Sphingobium yanoikuyae]|uniref:Uncharacterized protein n=1 Tax=Sphingobium yanoikuyae TaxID=13690 RepID=A0A430BZB7_SPHYA|nr:hypothetical protein [Sphingobium yanoikuyae]RSU58047.1 hypothetical protein DAH51_07330 [Sphingobium yanoikuyae]
MATQLAKTDQKVAAKAPVVAGNKLAAFVPQSIEEAWRLAGALAASGMTPKTYGNDQNKCMVGIIAGAEVGLTPFAALQSIAVINGTPSLWGDGMLALVQASGLLEDFEETDDGHTATCRAVRKGRATPIVRTFDMDQAKKAGLAGKQGPWVQYPHRMRQMRARAMCLRDGFADVLKGLKSAEEARDYAPMDGGTLTAERGISAAMLAAPEEAEQVDVVEQLEGPDQSQQGEANNGSAFDAAVAEIDRCPTADAIDSALARLRPMMETDEDADDLFSHAETVKAQRWGGAA